MCFQGCRAAASPVVEERPAIKFGEGHNGNDEQATIKVRLVERRSCVTFEGERDDIRVYQNAPGCRASHRLERFRT